MITTAKRDPIVRGLARNIYRTGIGLQCAVTARRQPRREAPRVFYAGGRSGNVGGPRVKLQRLAAAFPEHRRSFNLVYILSNAPHLPTFALKHLSTRQVPIVHNQNGVFYPGWFAGDWRARNADMARSYHRADHVLWQSEFCRRAADEFLGIREGPGEVLYNAVDTEVFAPRPGRSQDKPFQFLASGKVDTHAFYRLETALRGLGIAVEHGLDCSLTIAGWLSREASEAAGRLVQDLDLTRRVKFTGAYTQADAPAIYRQANAYISTQYNDACPNAVIEALASGLPVIYSATGGVPELVGETAGISLPCDTGWDRPRWPEPIAIAEAMTKVAMSQASMAAAARARAVERFTLTGWIERHRQVFQDLL